MSPTEVTVSRAVAAAPAKVFDVWMDPEGQGGPWSGVSHLAISPAVGGLFNFGVEHEGRTWAHYGRFLRIERPGKDSPGVAEFTWVSEATLGCDTVVTVTFQALGDETEVTLHQRNLPNEEAVARHKQGWTWMLDVLAERFSVHEEV